MRSIESPKFLPMPPRVISREVRQFPENSPTSPGRDLSPFARIYASRWELGSFAVGFAGRAIATRLGLPPEIIADTLKAASITSMMSLPVLEVVQYTALKNSAQGKRSINTTKIAEIAQIASRGITLAAIGANIEGSAHQELQAAMTQMTDLSLYTSHLPDMDIPMVGTVQFHETPSAAMTIVEASQVTVSLPDIIPAFTADSIAAEQMAPVAHVAQPIIVDQALTDLGAHKEYTILATEGVTSGIPEQVLPIASSEPATTVATPTYSLPQEAYDSKPPVVAAPPFVPTEVPPHPLYYFDDTTPSGDRITGTIEDLAINDLDWLLLDNGGSEITNLLADLGLSSDVNHAQFKLELQQAVIEYKNGSLVDDSPRGRLFHLCNSTQSMDNITHSQQMIDDLKALRVIS